MSKAERISDVDIGYVTREVPQFYSVETLGKILEVAPSTIRKWMGEGKIPYVKIMGSVRFSSAVIDEIIAAGERCQAQPPLRLEKKPAPAALPPRVRSAMGRPRRAERVSS